MLLLMDPQGKLVINRRLLKSGGSMLFSVGSLTVDTSGLTFLGHLLWAWNWNIDILRILQIQRSSNDEKIL